MHILGLEDTCEMMKIPLRLQRILVPVNMIFFLVMVYLEILNLPLTSKNVKGSRSSII